MMVEEKVQIIVGEDFGQPVVLQARSSLLEAHSSWFIAALDPSKGFKEALERVVKLPNYEAAAFQHCKYWMKHTIFKPLQLYKDWISSDSPRYTWRELAMTWLLAEQLGMQELCTAIVEAIITKHWQGIQQAEGSHLPRDWAAGGSNTSPKTIQYIYDNTASSSTLRELFVHMFIDTRAMFPLMDDLDDYPDAFAAAVKMCFEHMKWTQRPQITNLLDLDHLCGTGFEIEGTVNWGVRCSGTYCQHRKGNTADDFIVGTVWRCEQCPNASFCSVCECGDHPGPYTGGHKTYEQWPAVFLQTLRPCPHPNCARETWLDAGETGSKGVVQGDRLARMSKSCPRYYCLRCKDMFCESCGDDLEHGRTFHQLGKRRCDRCQRDDVGCNDCEDGGGDPRNFCMEYMCQSRGSKDAAYHQLIKIGGPESFFEDVLGREEYERRLKATLCIKCGGAHPSFQMCIWSCWKTPDHPVRDD